MRIKNKSNFWWVWSPDGPEDNGVHFDRQFVSGILPFPVPGDVASELEYQAFQIKEYVAGEEVDGWERVGTQWRPCFTVVDSEPRGALPDLNLTDLPEVLPETWADLLGKYTATGRLKKAFRGN